MEFIDLKTQYKALKEQIDERIRKVLEHGRYIMGPEVRELEERLEKYTGSKHCVTVSSGTEALLISLMSLGLQPGDEVITTPFTFISTAEVIVLLGAKPIWVDVEPDTCNIDASHVETLITSRTKAIIAVSLYGQPADMDTINAVAAQHGIAVIEDAAQSFGSEYKGDKSCNLSTVGCTSFFPSKPLGCYGDGGAIFTSDDALALAAREIRVHGQSKRYCHTRIGVGGRMDTLQCAIVLAKLEHFDWEIEQRILIGQRYSELLEKVDIQPVSVRSDRTSVFAQYTVFVENRESMQASLKQAGIPSAVHYPIPIHLQPAYREIETSSNLSNTLTVSKRVMSLPMHPYMDHTSQNIIVQALADSCMRSRT